MNDSASVRILARSVPVDSKHIIHSCNGARSDCDMPVQPLDGDTTFSSKNCGNSARCKTANTFASPKWRRSLQHRRPALELASHHNEAKIEYQDGSLPQLLTDQRESLNRLYNVVAPAGLDILLYNNKANYIVHCGKRSANFRISFVDLEEDKSKKRNRFNSEFANQVELNKKDSVYRRAKVDPMNSIEYTRPAGAQSPSPSPLAAPLFDGEESLGFLDVRPIGADSNSEWSILVRALLEATARAIEEGSFRTRHRREWVIALISCDGVGRSMLFAVDGQQRIVAMDRCARAIQASNGVEIGNGDSLWTIFKRQPLLFRLLGTEDISGHLVSLRTAEIWSAVATPPESLSSHRCSLEHPTLHCRPRLDSIGLICKPPSQNAAVGGLTSRTLQRVREYIDAHLAEDIGLEALAAVAGLSRCYFARAFRQSVGTPPRCYLMQRRVERAQHLLAKTDLPLAQIALESGFCDQSHFSRRFQLFLGVTPRCFRSSSR